MVSESEESEDADENNAQTGRDLFRKKLRTVMYSSTTGMEVKTIPSPINLIRMMTIIKMTITSSRFSINKMHLE